MKNLYPPSLAHLVSLSHPRRLLSHEARAPTAAVGSAIGAVNSGISALSSNCRSIRAFSAGSLVLVHASRNRASASRLDLSFSALTLSLSCFRVVRLSSWALIWPSIWSPTNSVELHALKTISGTATRRQVIALPHYLRESDNQ